MRRLSLGVLLLAIGLAGCGGDSTKPTGEPVPQAEVERAMKEMKAKGKDANK